MSLYSRRRHLAYFKIADEGWYSGVVVNVKNADSRSVDRRLEVEDLQRLVQDPSTGFLSVDADEEIEKTVQTFAGLEIEELNIEEVYPHGDNRHRIRDCGVGLTEKKNALRQGNAHLKRYVEVDYDKICLAGRSTSSVHQSPDGYPQNTGGCSRVNGASNGTTSSARDCSEEVEEVHSSSKDESSDPLRASSRPTARSLDDKASVSHSVPATRPSSDPPSSCLHQVQNRLMDMSFRPSGEAILLAKTKGLIHPTDFYVLDVRGQNFSCVIAEIHEEGEIGVAFSGVNLGRQGELCWVQIATSRCVFLFDVVALGDDTFENG